MKYIIPLTVCLSHVLASPGYVQLPVSVKHHSNSTHSHNFTRSTKSIHRRAEDFPVVLADDFLLYTVDISLGTPGQTQEVQIDTGSSDLWVWGPQSQGAEEYYDPSKSSTSDFVNNDFSINYVDGSSAQGSYYTDNAELGGVTANFQFAVVNQPYAGDSVFGIATSNSEAGGHYPNYPVALKQQGLIESTAFSLYLNDQGASTGSLLFGGVDTSKYSGQLYSVPITSTNYFNVNFEVEGEQLNGDLDSGTSFTYLPDDLVSSLAQKIGGVWNGDLGVYVVQQPSDISLTFSFSGAKVTVPSSELFGEYEGVLAFLIAPYSGTGYSIILGDSFLRSAYVVYDLDNNQIAIAQADYNGSGSIVPITSAGIPGAKPAPDL